MNSLVLEPGLTMANKIFFKMLGILAMAKN